VFLGNINIQKSEEEINEKTEERKVFMKNADLNEMDYSELILSIKVRSSSGKVSVASFIKTEIAFRQSKLEEREDSEIWITNIEELCLKVREKESQRTGSQFMVQ
jgi:hypothetical protein